MTPRSRLAVPVAFLLAGLAAAACSNPNSLPDATIANFVDSTTIGALTGTPISTPSGFSISDRVAVRTDRSSSFDFAFNIDASGKPVFLTLAVLGLASSTSVNPGLQPTNETFDAITTAPSNGYNTTDTVAVAEGQRFYARSRLVCSGLGVPQYAKLEITKIDLVARTVAFRYLVDNNCGYRGLQVGLPKN